MRVNERRVVSIMIDKTCENCSKYPCVKDSALLPSDKCHYPEDFIYKDNLVIAQQIPLSLKTRKGTEEERTFYLYADRNYPSRIWMDNDEGKTLLPETVFKNNWYESAQQRDKLSRMIAREMCNSLNPEYYDINPKFLQEASHRFVMGFAKEIIDFESEKKEKVEKNNDKGKINYYEVDTKVREFLESPDLLEKILEHIHTNLVGETANALITFFTCLSTKSSDPQNLKFSGDASTGKTKIVTSVVWLFADRVVLAGAMSKKSLVHKAPTKKENEKHIVDLDGKILVILEEENSKEFLDEIKPILSHDAWEIQYEIVEGSGKGHKTKTVILRGFPAYIGVSTETMRKEEQSTRTWTTAPIMSPEKYGAVNLDTAMRKMYPFKYEQNNEHLEVIQKAIKSLRKINVINPFAGDIENNFPHNEPRSMRDLKRLLSFIDCSAILHQYQRPKLIIDGEEYIVATVDDYKIGISLAETMMNATFSGIPNHVRDFFYNIMCKVEGEITYDALMIKYREVHGTTLPRSTLRDKYTVPLVERGWVSIDDSKKPYKFTINNFNGLTNFNGLGSVNLFGDNYRRCLNEICNISGLTECMYIGDRKLTIPPAGLKETIDKYIHSPLIRQSLLDEMKNGRETIQKTLTKGTPSNVVKDATKIKIISESDGWCEFCCEKRAFKKIEIDNEIRHICAKCLKEIQDVETKI